MEMIKKDSLLLTGAVIALGLAGCAKSPVYGLNDANKKYLEAYVTTYYPDATPTALGSYIIEQKDGDGDLLDSYDYIRCSYTVRTLDNQVSGTTDKILCQQLGEYDPSYCYNPEIWDREDDALYAGIEELIYGKHVGVYTKAIVPGWLLNSSRYDTAKEYLDNESGTNGIYEFKVVEAFDDVTVWETDSLVRFMKVHYPQVETYDTMSVFDSTKRYAQYYVRKKTSPYPDSTFDASAKVYLNYVGRRLDGVVFDTNIADTAKFYGIYDSGTTYGPTLINWGDTYDDLTMTSSETDIISGFKFALFYMKPYEAGTTIFHSQYGYSYSGSGNTIPSYSPLQFDLYLTDED